MQTGSTAGQVEQYQSGLPPVGINDTQAKIPTDLVTAEPRTYPGRQNHCSKYFMDYIQILNATQEFYQLYL